jgi:hypothetical protein
VACLKIHVNVSRITVGDVNGDCQGDADMDGNGVFGGSSLENNRVHRSTHRHRAISDPGR